MAEETQNGASGDGADEKVPAEGAETRTSERPAFRPRVDIYETERGLTLIADLPGAAPGGIDISLDGRELTLSARTTDDAPEGLSPLWREYRTGDWERRFTLTGDVDTRGHRGQVSGRGADAD